jgi:hypothetical protein
MEGLVMYLPEAAVRATLAFVASHSRGSSVVFDFFYAPMVERIAQLGTLEIPAAAKAYVSRFLSMIQDEPWQSGLPVDGEREYLRELGLTLREVLPVGGGESIKRYLTKADGTQLGAPALAEAMARWPPTSNPPGGGYFGRAVAGIRRRMREQQRMMAYQLADAVIFETEGIAGPATYCEPPASVLVHRDKRTRRSVTRVGKRGQRGLWAALRRAGRLRGRTARRKAQSLQESLLSRISIRYLAKTEWPPPPSSRIGWLSPEVITVRDGTAPS